MLTGGILVYAIGVDMCFPFETLFLRNSLHFSMTLVGLIVGVAGLVGLPFQLLGGAFADRVGRRGVLVLATLATALLYGGLALSNSLLPVVILVTIEAAFGWSMFLTASNAMVTDLTTEPRRAEAFGIVRTAINGPMIASPLIALAFLGGHPHYRLLFAAGAAVCLAFLVIVLGGLRESRPVTAARGSSERGYGHVLRDRRFLGFCAATLLPLYGYGQIVSTFPVAMQDAHGISAGQWARLLLAFGLSLGLLQYPVIRLTRSWNPLLLLSGASALIGVGLGLAPSLPWGWPSVTLVVFASLGVVVLIPVASTVVAAFAPVALRGRYMGTWTIVYLGGYALGPLCGGYAMDTMGSRPAFLVVAAAGLAGALCFVLLSRSRTYRAMSLGRPARVSLPDSSLEATLKPPVVGS